MQTRRKAERFNDAVLIYRQQWTARRLHLGLVGTVQLVAALVTILPDTVVLSCSDVARNFREFKFNARVRDSAIQGDSRVSIRTGLAKSLSEPSKAIFTTRPLGDREFASLGEVRGLADMSPVLLVGNPLPSITSGGQTAMEVFNVSLRAGIDG